jgi:hypothetical protein
VADDGVGVEVDRIVARRRRIAAKPAQDLPRTRAEKKLSRHGSESGLNPLVSYVGRSHDCFAKARRTMSRSPLSIRSPCTEPLVLRCLCAYLELVPTRVRQE